ncbi:MAG: hypothetical protein A2234_11245 [Elusimicrobia bacterium RIFOXYA2_FULL_58_8]|nr:MAG: hypothetical protein A2285_08555 [Elusimicrobia bacterium RIFOXYA12_FULL_57_11]OGS14515.1 MAG: hypothetical protein A2234_11245 [Elusimicrobia bacterium RIFOXYA2_FULL_58_8]
MCKNKKFRLNAAALLIFSLTPVFALAGAQCPGASVIETLLGAASSVNFVELSPAPANTPAAIAEAVQDKAVSPRPGKDLLPVIQDQARIRAILRLITDIYNGVHLPYSQDGATFTNREGRLPVQPLGFYKEYTLLTGTAPHTVTIGGITYQVAPDLSARGSERLIIGGGEKIYYTPDHYAKFIQLTMVY